MSIAVQEHLYSVTAAPAITTSESTSLGHELDPETPNQSDQSSQFGSSSASTFAPMSTSPSLFSSPSMPSLRQSMSSTSKTRRRSSLNQRSSLVSSSLSSTSFDTQVAPPEGEPLLPSSLTPSSVAVPKTMTSISTSSTAFTQTSAAAPPPMVFGDYVFPEVPTFEDLRHVLAMDSSSKQQDFRQALQLHTHLIGLALSARLSSGLDATFDHLHELFKNKQRHDQRSDFTYVFNFAHDEVEHMLQKALASPQPHPSFLDMMSHASSRAIMDFLHLLRTEPSILATAFRNLTSQELDGIFHPGQCLNLTGTRSEKERATAPGSASAHGTHSTQQYQYQQAMNHSQYQQQQHQQHQQQQQQSHTLHQSQQHPQPNQQQYQSQNPRASLQSISNTPNLIANFLNNQDLVHILLYNLFCGNSFESENRLRKSLLKETFKGLLNGKKGEKFMTETLDRYVNHSEWQHTNKARSKFEAMLLNLVRRGEVELAHVTDDELNAGSLQQPRFRPRAPGLGLGLAVDTGQEQENTRKSPGFQDREQFVCTPEEARQGRIEEFFVVACLEIFDLLESWMPTCIRDLSQEIFAELDDTLRPYATLVIVVKFFFYRFMHKCIAYPETYGMMKDIYISERSRQRILSTTHQRLYQYVTLILNPVPGWEGRSLSVDSRVRTVVERFARLLSTTPPQANLSSQSSDCGYTLKPIQGTTMPGKTRHRSVSPSIMPSLLLCPADFTTLFYFVCPQLKTPLPNNLGTTSPGQTMARSNTFGGKSSTYTRQRTTSDTPPAYKPPAGVGAATPVIAVKTHKRASPSFSFFTGASSAQKAKQQGPVILPEKTRAMTMDSSATAAACSPSNQGPTRSGSIPALSIATKNAKPDSDSPASNESTQSAPDVIQSVVKDWSHDLLLPLLKTAVQELKAFQPGPTRESTWALPSGSLHPLRESWALVYILSAPSTAREMDALDSSTAVTGSLAAKGLTMAPDCMAMVVENTGVGMNSRMVTVTTPILADQGMDSASSQHGSGVSVDLDLELQEADSEVNSRQQVSLAESKSMSILRVSSSHMLCENLGNRANHATNKWNDARREAVVKAWKRRLQDKIHSDHDLPDDVRTVAASVFKILREFDLVMPDTEGEEELDLQTLLALGIEQARSFGAHATAIGFHHALQVVQQSSILQQLDTSMLIYLLAVPVHNKLKHRAERTLARTPWETFAHSWHLRLVPLIEQKREAISSLRIKMYYQMCVRPSRAFERSRATIEILSQMNNKSLLRYTAGFASDPYNSRNQCDEAPTGGWGVGAGASSGSYGDSPGYTPMTYGGSNTTQKFDVDGRRHSSNTSVKGGNPFTTAKTRRSSFSTYIDNMTSRSYPSASTLDASLEHLIEREQATFAVHASNGQHQSPYRNKSRNNSNNSLNQFRSAGEAADAVQDFVMDSNAIEAVQKWVHDAGIHNFVPGEDHFHRFCMEVESIIRGIGLGGTGIQGAGIPQAANGTMSANLSSSGSDFFVKEVQKFHGAFVPGMAPNTELAIPPAKTGGAAGVAEYLVNSFRGGVNQSQAGLTIPNAHQGVTGSGSAGSMLHQRPSAGGGATTTPPPATNNDGVSKFMIRRVLLNNHHSSVQQGAASSSSSSNGSLSETEVPVAMNDAYYTPAGPAYTLYNPGYSTSSIGTRSSITSSGVYSTIAGPLRPLFPPKDRGDFLLQIQLKLTNFILSEWLDVFGEIESDFWFMEFLQDLQKPPRQKSPPDSKHESKEQASQKWSVPTANLQKEESKRNEAPPVSALTDPSKASSIRASQSNASSLASLAISDRSEMISSWSSCSTRDTTRQHMLAMSAVSGTEADFEDFTNVDKKSGFNFALPPSTSASTSVGLNTRASMPKIGVENSPGSRPVSGLTIRRAEFERSEPSQGASVLKSERTSIQRPKAYDLDAAYHAAIQDFENTDSPYQKLGHLFALELLVVSSISYPGARSSVFDDRFPNGDGSNLTNVPKVYTPGTDEIVNTIEDLFRRQEPICSHDDPTLNTAGTSDVDQGATSTTAAPFHPSSLYCSPECTPLIPSKYRPRNLLRDMQLIATFVPGSILDLRDDGKAFWDMSLAVTSLKREVVDHVVQLGLKAVELDDDSAIAVSENKSGSRQMIKDEEDERLRMHEAVRLFTIAAKESSAIAQRELAILYMSLPVLPASSSPLLGYSSAFSSFGGGNSGNHHPHHLQSGRISPFMSAINTASTLSKIKANVIGGRSTPPPAALASTAPLPHGPHRQHSFSSVPGAGRGETYGSSSASSRSLSIQIKPQHGHTGSGNSTSSTGSGGSLSGSGSGGGGVFSGLGLMAGFSGSYAGSSTASLAATPTTTTANAIANRHKQSSNFSPECNEIHTESDFQSRGSLHQRQQQQQQQQQSTLAFADGHDLQDCQGAPRVRRRHTRHHHYNHGTHQQLQQQQQHHHCHRHSHQTHQLQSHQCDSFCATEAPLGYGGSNTSTHGPHQSRHNGGGPEKYNPQNVASALHWFTLAAAQGDQFSIDYLKHKEQAGSIFSGFE